MIHALETVHERATTQRDAACIFQHIGVTLAPDRRHGQVQADHVARAPASARIRRNARVRSRRDLGIHRGSIQFDACANSPAWDAHVDRRRAAGFDGRHFDLHIAVPGVARTLRQVEPAAVGQGYSRIALCVEMRPYVALPVYVVKIAGQRGDHPRDVRRAARTLVPRLPAVLAVIGQWIDIKIDPRRPGQARRGSRCRVPVPSRRRSARRPSRRASARPT